MRVFSKVKFILSGLEKSYKINLGIGVPILISLLVIGFGNIITDELNIGGSYGVDPLDIGESWFLWFVVIAFIMYFEWILFSSNSFSLEERNNKISEHVVIKIPSFSLGSHPWRRYFARTIDVVIFANLMFFVLILVYIFFPSMLLCKNNLTNEEQTFYYLILLSFFYVPSEALLLYMTGSTPGKFIFGISVVSKDGNKIGFVTAIERTMSVWIKGFAFGIPGISLFTMLYSYDKLKNSGITNWDKSNNTKVLHRVWGIWRYIFSTISVILAFIILSLMRDMSQ